MSAKMENETMMEEDEKRAARCGNRLLTQSAYADPGTR
jgi:hypothetical protein